MLSVIVPSVIMLNVVAPNLCQKDNKTLKMAILLQKRTFFWQRGDRVTLS
jgi:hypothetical protein